MARALLWLLTIIWIPVLAGGSHELRYTLTPLVLTEEDGVATWFRATGLNDKGEISGVSSTPRCYLWRDGHFIHLGDFEGGVATYCEALGINDRSEIVGVSAAADGRFHAFLWRRGDTEDLGMESGETAVFAFGINNRREVIGDAWDSEGASRPWYWRSGERTFLPLSVANGINARGEIVGISMDGRSAAVIRRGTVIELPGLPGAIATRPAGINDRGDVVGTSMFGTYSRALIWNGERTIELPLLESDEPINVVVGDINNRREVVGTVSGSSGAQKAVIWIDARIYELDGLIALDDPLASRASLTQAWGLNNRGWILAAGMLDGKVVDFLLTPVSR